jgi:hypothetical protein
MTDRKIPVLTDVVAGPATADASGANLIGEEELAELQTRLATEGYVLMERLLHESLREMEANLFADVISRLRTELPDLIDEILREHLGRDTGRR